MANMSYFSLTLKGKCIHNATNIVIFNLFSLYQTPPPVSAPGFIFDVCRSQLFTYNNGSFSVHSFNAYYLSTYISLSTQAAEVTVFRKHTVPQRKPISSA